MLIFTILCSHHPSSYASIVFEIQRWPQISFIRENTIRSTLAKSVSYLLSSARCLSSITLLRRWHSIRGHRFVHMVWPPGVSESSTFVYIHRRLSQDDLFISDSLFIHLINWLCGRALICLVYIHRRLSQYYFFIFDSLSIWLIGFISVLSLPTRLGAQNVGELWYTCHMYTAFSRCKLWICHDLTSSYPEAIWNRHGIIA